MRARALLQIATVWFDGAPTFSCPARASDPYLAATGCVRAPGKWGNGVAHLGLPENFQGLGLWVWVGKGWLYTEQGPWPDAGCGWSVGFVFWRGLCTVSESGVYLFNGCNWNYWLIVVLCRQRLRDDIEFSHVGLSSKTMPIWVSYVCWTGFRWLKLQRLGRISGCEKIYTNVSSKFVICAPVDRVMGWFSG